MSSSLELDTLAAAPQAFALAEQIARTDFVPRSLRGNAPAVMAAILAGRELGVEPMQSLRSIHVVDGRPTYAAELVRALIFRAGHELRVVETSSRVCIVEGRRKGDDGPPTRVEWTIADAERAKLAGKNNWRAYPRQMLLARATAELARVLFPDVTFGFGIVEELDEVVDADPEGAVPPPTRVKRRRPADREVSAGKEARADASTGAPLAPPPLPDELDDTNEVVEAELVDDPEMLTPDQRADRYPEPEDEPPPPRDRSDAERFHIHGAKAGLDEDARRALIALASQGRTRSAAELEPDELAVARSYVDDLESGVAILGFNADGDAELRPRDGATVDTRPSTLSAATLTASAKASGASGAALLRIARDLAAARGGPTPKSLDELAALPDLAALALAELDPPF